MPRHFLIYCGLCLLVLSGRGAPAAVAQTHPCDVTPPTTPQPGTKLGFCHDLKDTDGQAIPLAEMNFRITGGPTVAMISAPTPIGSASPSGEFYFEYTLGSLGLPRGTWSLTVTALATGLESGPSNSASWQNGKAPKPPKNKGPK